MGIMLVYDITNEKSFENIVKWLRNIDEHANEDVERMILGNKCDMTDKRVVSKERGEGVSLCNLLTLRVPSQIFLLDCSRVRNPIHGNISQSQHQHRESILRARWSDSRPNLGQGQQRRQSGARRGGSKGPREVAVIQRLLLLKLYASGFTFMHFYRFINSIFYRWKSYLTTKIPFVKPNHHHARTLALKNFQCQ